jgi:short-subunit dehydrogenase
VDLTNKTVLITGANRGMGLAFAKQLAELPLAHLILGTRDPNSAPQIDAPPGGAARVTWQRLDLGSIETIKVGVAELNDLTRDDHHAGIDVLVNNAGQLVAGLLESQDPIAIERMLQVNLHAPIHLTRLLLPDMLARGSGLVVNNASISGYAYFPATTTYAATKAGLVAFSEALRRELDGTGVNVLHLVTPRIETDMAESMDDQYAGLVDTKAFESTTSEEWAQRVVSAMQSGQHILNPGGRTSLAKLGSRLPASFLDRASRSMFTRPEHTTNE